MSGNPPTFWVGSACAESTQLRYMRCASKFLHKMLELFLEFWKSHDLWFSSGTNHKIAYTTHTCSHGSTDLGPPKTTLGHLLLPMILVGHCKNFNDYTAWPLGSPSLLHLSNFFTRLLTPSSSEKTIRISHIFSYTPWKLTWRWQNNHLKIYIYISIYPLIKHGWFSSQSS